IATSCRTQWVQKLIQEKQVQYTGIIDLFQPQNVSKLYIQCNFFTDLGESIMLNQSLHFYTQLIFHL
ncbi:MAG: hypothetical protein KKE73_11220, partial [Proteobacteria bacterium]|nr:hypothetical protein [Pseudomonadota bacterium]